MCITIDLIDRACGLLLLNEFNTFVYFCKMCQCEFDTGPNLEVHILSLHQDDKSHIESLFVNDGILVDDCPIEQTQLQTCTTSLTSKVENIGEKEKNVKNTDDNEKEIVQSIEKDVKIPEKFIGDLKFQSTAFSQSSAVTSFLLNSDEESHDSMIDNVLAKVKPKKQKRRRNEQKPKQFESSTKQVFYCDMCPNITLSTLNIVRAHMRRHCTKGFLKTCEICGKKPRNLEKHMRMNHMEERPYKCDFCDNCYRTNNNRLIHMRVHTLEKPFLCETCGKSFHSLSSKTKHIKQVHTKKRAHQCPECGRGFIVPCHLKEHIFAFHTKERPFICEICSDAFSTTGNLRRHKLTHGERTKQCRYCEKSFKTNRTRRSHEKAIHKIAK